MTRLSVFLLFAASAPLVQAQIGVLRPEMGPVFDATEYDVVLYDVFQVDPMECHGGVRMITVPSFTPETSTGTCTTPSGPVAFWAAPESSLNAAIQSDTTQAREWTPEVARAVRINRAQVALDADVAARVTQVWERAIRTARYPDPDDRSMGTDGIIFHIASTRYGLGSVQAWSPSENSLAGAVVALGWRLGQVARGQAVLADLVAEIDRVETFLSVGPDNP